MSVTNLRQKSKLLTPSVQPVVRTDYRAVTATATVSKLARENSLRKELMVTNTSTAPLYLAFGFLPSATDYAIALPYNAVLFTESTDALNGVWASAAGGQANIVERF